MKNKLYLVIAIALLVLGASAYGAYYYYGSMTYVAKVDGQKITKPQFNFFLAQVKEEMEAKANLADEQARKAFWNSKIEGQNAVDIAKDRALDRSKEFAIQMSKANKKNIKLANDDISKVDKNIQDTINQLGGKAQADTKLKEMYDISLNEYSSILKDLLYIYKFIQEEQKSMKFTDAQINEYYKTKMETADTVTVAHILIKTIDDQNKPLPEDKIKEAEKKANDLLTRVKNKENIGQLAKQYSEDPGSKDKGGIYTFKKGQMVPEFEEWSFVAKPGDSGIVKTTYGFHVMKKPEFIDLKESIKQNLAKTKYIKQLDEWKKQYNLEKNNKVLNTIKLK